MSKKYCCSNKCQKVFAYKLLQSRFMYRKFVKPSVWILPYILRAEIMEWEKTPLIWIYNKKFWFEN